MKIKTKKELYELNSSLIKLDNSKIYNPPEGYFEQMQETVLDKFFDSADKKSKIIKVRWMMGIAAAILLVVGIMFVMNPKPEGIGTVSMEEVYDYLDENIESLNEESFTIVSDNYELNLEDSFDVDNDDISEYLDESLDDITEEDLEQIF